MIRLVLAMMIPLSLLTAHAALDIDDSEASVFDSIFGLYDGNKGQGAFEKDQKAALADEDPWHAWQVLSANPPAEMSEKVRSQYADLASSLILKAARQGNRDALITVFSRGEVREFISARAELYGPLLKLAEQADGGREDMKLLSLAGDILQKGQWIIQDSQRAAGFYARAWLAGDNDAPGSLYRLYQYLRDPASAYLWSLRCIGKCTAISEEGLALESLSPRQIQWIQKLAHDKSVITVNGLAVRKELQ